MNPIEILEQDAVNAAMIHDWDNAIKHNLDLLKIDDQNLGAYLRLGFGYLQTNHLRLAKKYYHKALKIQQKNTIATEYLERIKIFESKSHKSIIGKTLFDPNLFIEIPGKTKSVSLVNHGQKNILAKLMVGQSLLLKIKKRRVEVRTDNNEYIGSLPDDLSHQLMIFLEAGSEYTTIVKEANLSNVTVFIRENKKGRSVSHRLSFPHTLNLKEPLINNSEDKDNEDDIENTDEEENTWEKIVAEVNPEEKETVPGIQTNSAEDDEE